MGIEEKWRPARLIPTSGIKSATDQEMRATSALLSVLTVVPGFAHGMLKPCGAPLGRVRAQVETYVEVAFENKKGRKSARPDGLIRVTRGKSTWIALVEVKTRNNLLDIDQVESYMDLAKEQRFDAVITISNEIPPVLGAHPLPLNRQKLRSIPVFHFSWVRLISIAVMEHKVHGIEDPEQKWILGELIEYLESDSSGTLDFTDMGMAWSPFLETVKSGLVKKSDGNVAEVASTFDGLIRYLCLKLGQKLGADVTPYLPRKQANNPELRTSEVIQELERDSTMTARIRIPNTVADLEVSCDVRGKLIRTYCTVDASDQARNSTRVNFLVKPLAKDISDVTIIAKAGRKEVDGTLAEFREDLEGVLSSGFPEINRFTVMQTHAMGVGKTTRAGNSFINSVDGAINSFYADILQHLRHWVSKPPAYKRKESNSAGEETLSTEDIASGKSEIDQSELEVPSVHL